MFGMLGVFAEFEQAMIQASVNAGLAYAKAHGTKTGRAIVVLGSPRHRRQLSAFTLSQAPVLSRRQSLPASRDGHAP